MLKALGQAKRRWVTEFCEGTKNRREKVINNPKSGCRLASAIHKIHVALLTNLQTMKTAADYRKHAHECRVLAQQMPSGEQRSQLLKMAKTWENLAQTREGLVRNHPELDTGKAPPKGQVPSEP